MRQARPHQGSLARAALLVILTASPAARGVVAANWNEPAGGTWTDPANWTANVRPGADDIAGFELGSAGGYTVTLPAGQATAVNTLNVMGDRVTLAQEGGSTMTIGSVHLGAISPQSASLTLSGGVFSAGTLSTNFTPASVEFDVAAGTSVTLGGIDINDYVHGGVVGHIRIDGPGTTVSAGSFGGEYMDVSLTRRSGHNRVRSVWPRRRAPWGRHVRH